MDYKIIDNFLSNSLANDIEAVLLTSQYSNWYLQNDIVGDGNVDDNLLFYMIHTFYSENKIQSNSYSWMQYIMNKMDVKALIRIKANLYPRTEFLHIHSKHTDYPYSHKGAIYYVNDNDGFTILNDDVRIESKKNRLLMFDPSIPHQSTTCTDARYRVNINFNYF
jgi:hypothetical protein